jgi:hypothetical protein
LHVPYMQRSHEYSYPRWDRVQDGQICNWPRAMRLILRSQWDVLFGRGARTAKDTKSRKDQKRNETDDDALCCDDESCMDIKKYIDTVLYPQQRLFLRELSSLSKGVVEALSAEAAAAYGLLLMERCEWDRRNSGVLFHRARECFHKGQTWWCRFWVAYTASFDHDVQWQLVQRFKPELLLKCKSGDRLAQYWNAYIHRFRSPEGAFKILKHLALTLDCPRSSSCLLRAFGPKPELFPSLMHKRLNEIQRLSSYPPMLGLLRSRRAYHDSLSSLEKLVASVAAWCRGLASAYILASNWMRSPIDRFGPVRVVAEFHNYLVKAHDRLVGLGLKLDNVHALWAMDGHDFEHDFELYELYHHGATVCATCTAADLGHLPALLKSDGTHGGRHDVRLTDEAKELTRCLSLRDIVLRNTVQDEQWKAVVHREVYAGVGHVQHRHLDSIRTLWESVDVGIVRN